MYLAFATNAIYGGIEGWDRFVKWPEGITAWAIIATLIVIGWQSWETRKAAQATRKSAEVMEKQTSILEKSVDAAQKAADAAEVSAKAAMGVAVPTLKITEFVFGADPNNPATFQRPRSRIVVKNYGSTPAFLLAWNVNYALPMAPNAPLGNGHPLDRIVVEPGGTHTLGVQETIWPTQTISIAEAEAIIAEEKQFTVYGYITYGSVFDDMPLRRLIFYEHLLAVFPSANGDIGSWLPVEGNEYIKKNPN
jgi:hypothetical protein